MHRRNPLSRAFLAVIAVASFASAAASCKGEEVSTPISALLGGGEAWIYSPDGPSTCPSSHPTRRVVGDAVVCAETSVDFGAVTRTECAEANLDCNALYGCEAKRLSLCDATSTTADCGGSGPPVFACREVSGCIWFTRGCLANGFDASYCPVDDVCCVAADGGGESAYNDFAHAGAASDFIDDYGTEMIGLDEYFTLDVVEAEPSSFTSPSITCPAPDAHPFLCGATSWALVHNAAGNPPWFVGRQDLGSYGFTVERRTLGDGTTKGRVCLYSHIEEKVAACPATPPAEPRCATGGTLTLGATSGRAEFTFASGTWVVDFYR